MTRKEAPGILVEAMPRAVRESVRDGVLAELRALIVSLSLAPGTPLSENELAAEMGVSRTPVRESLILLREEGLVQVVPQVGTFVSLVDIAQVADAQFVREAIECASMAQLVDVIDDQDVAELRKLLSAQASTAESGDNERFFELDEDFHRALLRIGGHANAWTVVNSAKAHLDRARRLSLVQTRSIPGLVQEHTQIVDALESREVPGAVAHLREHLQGVLRDVRQFQQTHPESFAAGKQSARRRSYPVLPAVAK